MQPAGFLLMRFFARKVEIEVRKRLGDILKDQGPLSDQQLAVAWTSRKRTGERLGQTLSRLGFVTGSQVTDALSEHLKIERVHLARRYLGRKLWI